MERVAVLPKQNNLLVFRKTKFYIGPKYSIPIIDCFR